MGAISCASVFIAVTCAVPDAFDFDSVLVKA